MKRSGITILELLVVIGIVSLLLAISVVAVQKARAAATRAECQNNLRQLGIALTQYHDARRQFPPGTGSAETSFPFLNWHARILPFLEQGAFWGRIERTYRWERNFLVQSESIRAVSFPFFVCPAGGRTNADAIDNRPALTYYLGVLGVNATLNNGMLFMDSKVKVSDVPDGRSNTLFAGERPPSPGGEYGWWYAGWGQNKDGAMEAVMGVQEFNRVQLISQRGCQAASFKVNG
ncbi:MAG: DUF1559 domain-containing protein [Planctomycetes bacterium]|nr:DUF1559 domain-containing protein [Planctomycetota bacterium]